MPTCPVSRSAAAPAQRAGSVNFGDLRRLTPLSQCFGYDRGTPVARAFIADFLRRHAADIRGRVLEVGDAAYTRQFGGPAVSRSDVLHARPGNSAATLVGDLAAPAALPEATFDCFIATHVLQCILDIRAAIAGCARLLRPGGVLLATLPCITRTSRYDMERWGDYWRCTSALAGRLFGEVFGAANVRVTSYGNVLAAAAALFGLAAEELDPAELVHVDPDYEMVVAVRALKRDPAADPGTASR